MKPSGLFPFWLTLFAIFCFASVQAHAKDHSEEYKVGVFSATGQLSDGSFANCKGNGCSMYSAAHNIHYVRTPDGMYAIEAPVSVGRSILLGVLTDGVAPMVHKEWFMDQLHEGDKILFASQCNKHNNCTFWLPDPDHTGKEFATLGYYRADAAKTNTQTLCGKGKLSPAVEAQVCPATPAAGAAPTSGPAGASASASTTALINANWTQIKANGDAGKNSDAAAAAKDAGYTGTLEAMAALVKNGLASRCVIVTNPVGAEIDIDGKRAGVSPMEFFLYRHPDADRVITIKMTGFNTVEKKASPDGNDIVMNLTLETLPAQ